MIASRLCRMMESAPCPTLTVMMFMLQLLRMAMQFLIDVLMKVPHSLPCGSKCAVAVVGQDFGFGFPWVLNRNRVRRSIVRGALQDEHFGGRVVHEMNLPLPEEG